MWEDTKVRDLLDSLFVGFPVGTLVVWHTTNEKEAGIIKDIAAAAVGIAMLAWFLVLGFEAGEMLGKLP